MVLKELVLYRNARTGRCDPSRGHLAYATGYSDRRVDAALRTLTAAPEEGGHGLVVRQRRRRGGNQTSNRYWFAPRFYELYREALSRSREERGTETYIGAPERNSFAQQSETPSPSRAKPLRPNDPSSSLRSSPCSSSPDRFLTEGEHIARTDARTHTAPPVDPFQEAQPEHLEAFDRFADAFWHARAARYEESPATRRRGDDLGVQDREAVGTELRNLTARACSRAAARGLDLDLDPVDVSAALARGLALVWLEHPGGRSEQYNGKGFLERIKHPLERLLDDLSWVGEKALERWEQSALRTAPKPHSLGEASRSASPGDAATAPRPEPRRVAVIQPEVGAIDFTAWPAPRGLVVDAPEASPEPELPAEPSTPSVNGEALELSTAQLAPAPRQGDSDHRDELQPAPTVPGRSAPPQRPGKGQRPAPQSPKHRDACALGLTGNPAELAEIQAARVELAALCSTAPHHDDPDDEPPLPDAPQRALASEIEALSAQFRGQLPPLFSGAKPIALMLPSVHQALALCSEGQPLPLALARLARSPALGRASHRVRSAVALLLHLDAHARNLPDPDVRALLAEVPRELALVELDPLDRDALRAWCSVMRDRSPP